MRQSIMVNQKHFPIREQVKNKIKLIRKLHFQFLPHLPGANELIWFLSAFLWPDDIIQMADLMLINLKALKVFNEIWIYIMLIMILTLKEPEH